MNGRWKTGRYVAACADCEWTAVDGGERGVRTAAGEHAEDADHRVRISRTQVRTIVSSARDAEVRAEVGRKWREEAKARGVEGIR